LKPAVVRILQATWLILLLFVVYILIARTQAGLAASVTHQQAALLHGAGLPAGLLIDYDAAFGILFELAWLAVSAILIWRRPDDPMVMLTAFALLLMGGVGASSDPKIPASVPEPLLTIGNVLAAAGMLLLFLFFYLFPDARIIRPRLGVVLLVLLIMSVLPLPPPPRPLALVGLLVFFGPFAIVMYTQVYRYRRISSPAQRQQTKWIVYGLIVGILGFFLTGVISNVPAVQASLPAQFLVTTGLYGFWMLIPLVIGFAILRYRLYDVDVLVNRTLVYGSLTVSLIALYIAGVIALQSLARIVTGQSSDLAVAIVTLAIAALFNPWRTRVQRFIDHRFYRRKYDAVRSLGTFSGRLKDQTDLDVLAADLIDLLQDTVQPVTANLWLREKEEAR